jgi:hypothetical protein
VFYAGRHRYIGVFDSTEKAFLAYDIASQVLNIANRCKGPVDDKEVVKNVQLAQKAAAGCVSALAKEKSDECIDQ